ncbi:sulfotransferase [Salinisphaera sp. P385]|uniref:Sulfotransferase n=1 Tax=Spectribacter acetivorans TaxID=3075603 RepID=A0ABU3BCP9_9GAMM|nr:sulfotransferase [Salinisphaera sp. P385]MDT0619875.1 sulfotransferase [Salinisphaera sp. P385]
MHFFIAGYPKAGTTSLYDYLGSHPDVFVPKIKEPHYFTEDYPGSREVTTGYEYRALYRDAEPYQQRGDASASVIHSDVAIDRILERYPEAKFIVLVRDPVAAVRSFHGELLHNLNEDMADFERAWRLQAARAEGRDIPATCREPRFLQYREIFHYREQLPAFFKKVPAEQRLVLVFEEFFADPRAGYRQVLDFLGLEDDRRSDFCAVNTARRHRFRWLAERHRKMVDDDGWVYRGLKGAMSRMGIHPSDILARFNRKPGGKPAISAAFEAELREHFRPDVEAVEHLLGREIEHWRH